MKAEKEIDRVVAPCAASSPELDRSLTGRVYMVHRLRCGCRVVLTGGSATQGVACHELNLEKFGVQHPVFSTALAFYGYKGSNLSLAGL